MKKFVLPIAVSVSVILIAGLCFYFFSKPDVYTAIPDSAIAVLEISDWSKFSNQLNTVASAAELGKTPAVKKLTDEVSVMGELLGSNPAIKTALYNSKLTLSVHLTSADDFDYLFSIPVSGVDNDDICRLLNVNPGLPTINKRTFNGHNIVDVAMRNGRKFSFTVIHHILSFSFNSFLTETSVTAIAGGNNLANYKGLKKVIKKQQGIDGARLLVNFDKRDVIFPVFVKPGKAGLLSDIPQQGWGSYVITLMDDRISLTGFNYTGMMSEESAGNVLGANLWRGIIPADAAYVSVGLNNLQPAKKVNKEEKVSLPEQMLKDNFKDWADDQHAFVTLEPLQEDFTDRNVFIIKVKDEEKAVAGLKHLVAMDGSNTDAIDSFMQTPIYNLKGGGVITQLFGSRFTVFGNVFYAVNNHKAFFCNNEDVLKLMLEKAGVRKGQAGLSETAAGLLELALKMVATVGDTSNKLATAPKTEATVQTAGKFVYVSPAKSSLLFSGLLKEGPGLKAYLATLNSVVILSNAEGEWNATDISLVTGSKRETGGGVLWKTKLKAPSDFKPQIVLNGGTHEHEIFTQDTANNIYLMNKSGEIIFTRNIGEKIMGSVQQLDYYHNGDLQYIFNTVAHVWMIDRAGNDFASYPLRLSAAAATGLTLVNSGSKYDYYIPCSNGAVYGYEASGRPLPGWSPRNGVGVVGKPLQAFVSKQREYLLAFNSAGKLMLLSGKGETKWSVDNLPLAGQNFSVVQTGDDFLVMNAAGNQLIEISADGNDKLKPLPDSALSFTATATSDTGYQYFFGSLHGVRCYDGSGAFKNAVGLKQDLLGGIDLLDIAGEKYIMARDETAGKIMIYDVALKPVAEYAVANTGVYTIGDLFDRKEFIGVQPKGNSLECYRIK